MSIIDKIKRLVTDSKVFKNSAALVVGKVVQKIIAFFVSILSARYLGPSGYGLVGYAASLTAFAEPIARLGHPSIVAYECMDKPEQEGKILGSSIIMQACSGLVCVLGVIIAAYCLNPNSQYTVLITAAYSLELIFVGFDILSCWFQVHYISKYVAISSTLAYIAVSAYKIMLLVKQADIIWFALAQTIDFIVLGIVFYICYKRKKGPKLGISKSLCVSLWKRGRSFIIANIMVVIYMQTDKIMLKGMISENEVAYYTVAASIISMWTFVLSSVISASMPMIIEHSKVGKKEFEDALTGLFSMVAYACIIVGLLFYVFAKPIILLLYDTAYIDAIPTVRVLAWGTMFSYWGVARNIWFVVENKQSYVKWLSMIGAVANVVMNYVLIKMMGLIGAAIATVITEIIVNFVAGLFFKEVRKPSILMAKSLSPSSLKKIKLLFQ